MNEEIIKTIRNHIENLAVDGWNRLYYEREKNIVVTFREEDKNEGKI